MLKIVPDPPPTASLAIQRTVLLCRPSPASFSRYTPHAHLNPEARKRLSSDRHRTLLRW